ncbi:hypothetical protein [Pararhodobacter oceanensis]|uniref:Uncharacterized protein n=1 Tax=Pararhodobacter oceanensis TaxID=2172121 RepID=A0A2T8HV01_9RHOB|nr:hypothetical protein [Pararhodobacter oceanensis]PVH29277.1 hypothetical protein DDE20_09710 [Pararhodobacter oceanensis]
MRPQSHLLLAAAALALSLTGAAHAYSVFERNDSTPIGGDVEDEYGDVSGTCNNGTAFTIRYQTDHRGRLYFEDLENQGPDEDAVIREACDE